ncbi:MAG: NAD(P)H-dependent glycerol-3-phosphate dehydrogenase [Mycobacteriales bacterium]
MTGPTKVAVIGAGSWGTTFAKVLADAGAAVTLVARRPALAARVRADRENVDYLPGVRLPPGVEVTADAATALDGAALAAVAVLSHTLRAGLADWGSHLEPGCTVLSLMKGIELGTGMRMSEVIAEATGTAPAQIVVLTGPNLAREIAAEQPTASVVACTDHARAAAVQQLCQTAYFRPYTNTDVIGCELGGAVKNVIALACGMAEGLGFGDNSRASLVTRGLAETARLGAALGADPATFAGLAGLGDLVATCASPLSRNRTVGERLGRGERLADIEADTRQVAEGVRCCRSVLDLGRRVGVDMPITHQVVRVCRDGMRPADAVAALMGRVPRPE